MTITKEELDKILEEHSLWLRDNGGKRANLCGADLCEADLHEVNLIGANLCEANLRGADFRGANLCGADLCKANLDRADLRGANFYMANFYGADLYGAKNIPFIPMVCPDTGNFIAWKKANGYIIKLQIPEDARRSSATGRKCRADKAIVLAIENFDGTPAELEEVKSNYNPNFIYKIGETVSVDNFCEDRFKECAPGIHFFINREEAIQYSFL